MWYFASPEIVYGEGALSHLGQIEGRRAFVVTDANIQRLGLADLVKDALVPSGMETDLFGQVEPEPSMETARAGAKQMAAFQPDWIIAVGGGSVMDAAKAMWILYERPEMEPEAINPIEKIGLRKKARFIAIPTTSGTGSEATWAMVLTDPDEKRKLGLGNREALPDIAILDPEMVKDLPPMITADTGMDVLVHAVEGFTSTWHNDFCDGLCLKAIELVLDNLPKVVKDGTDIIARSHMQNAAAIAGLGFGNSMAALAHGLGHAFGADFHLPHGRSVGLFLPYTIEYSIGGEEGSTRYAPLARFMGLRASCEAEAAREMVHALRSFTRSLGLPLTLREAGIDRAELESRLDHMAGNALNDTQTIMGTRVPDLDEIRKLFYAALDGQDAHF